MTHHRGWKAIVLGTIAGLSLVGFAGPGHANMESNESTVRTDNSGPGSLHSGRGESSHRGQGFSGGDHNLMAQIGDLRQEDRRMDRREDRREDRQLDRRQDRREDRQLDRREDRRADHRSNAGGELRGLDRADSVAGEHGREGRENARMMQLDRPNRPERMERIERPERPDRDSRPERPERPERGGRH